jgi:hypothetical protein
VIWSRVDDGPRTRRMRCSSPTSMASSGFGPNGPRSAFARPKRAARHESCRRHRPTSRSRASSKSSVLRTGCATFCATARAARCAAMPHTGGGDDRLYQSHALGTPSAESTPDDHRQGPERGSEFDRSRIGWPASCSGSSLLALGTEAEFD